MNKEFLKNNWKYLLVLLLIFVPLFQHLGSLTIRIWDESRLAINAYEMYHHGNYLIPTFNGEPDFPLSKIQYNSLCFCVFNFYYAV